MNIKQKIVAGTTCGFILGSIGFWAITGFQIFTKTKVPVEVVDELFGTKSIEWQNKFIFGFDLAGPIAAAVMITGGILYYILRTRNKS